MDEQRRIDSDFDEAARFVTGISFAVGIAFLILVALFCVTRAP